MADRTTIRVLCGGRPLYVGFLNILIVRDDTRATALMQIAAGEKYDIAIPA